MTEMDGIEAAAKQTYAHRRAGSSKNMRLAPHLAVTPNHVLVCRKLVQAHRPPRVEPVSGYSGFRAEAEFKAIGKAGRRVHVNRSGIDLACKARLRRRVLGDDTVRKMRAMPLYEFNCLLQRIHDLDRENHIQIFGVPVFGRCWPRV